MAAADVKAARIVVVLVTAAVLQRGLFSRLDVAGAVPDVFLLLAIAAGLTRGSDRGAIIGFFSGLTLDLLVQTPLGLSALVYCLIGFAAGRFERNLTRASRVRSVLATAALSIAGVALYAVVSVVVGQSSAVVGKLPAVMAVTAVSNAVLALPAMRVMRWAWPDESRLHPVVR